MSRRLITPAFVLLALYTAAFADGFPPRTLGLGFGAQPDPAPLQLPLAQSSSSIFTFLGSFKVATTLQYPAGAMSVSNGTLYLGANCYDPVPSAYNSGAYAVSAAISAVTIPTLSGTPAYNGSNYSGTATATTPTCGATYVAPVEETISSGAPADGATSATFAAVPSGIAVGADWYITFITTTGTHQPTELVTGVSGTTLSFAALPTPPSGISYTATGYIHQWFPPTPFGTNTNGFSLTGSLPYNGNLYLAGRVTFDNDTSELGWILQSNTAATSYGNVYSALGNCKGGTNTIEYSRKFGGSLGLVPQIWQSLLGGPAFVANGIAPSITENNQPIGFGLYVFNPATITTSGASDFNPKILLDSCYNGDPTTRTYNDIASYSFSGPFPLTTTTGYYPATITGGNGTGTNGLTGATQVTLAVPTETVTGTASFSATSFSFTIDSITSGTLSNSGIWYSISANGIPSNTVFNPSESFAPGSSLGPGTYLISGVSSAAESAVSFTATPLGYGTAGGEGGYFEVWFSDGETRIGHLNQTTGNITFPEAAATQGSGGNFCTQAYPNCDPTTFSALTCASCTTSITIAPLGDNWASTYDGPLGTAFIEPRSRSLLFIGVHQYGTDVGRRDYCAGGNSGQAASGTNETPIYPDTDYYTQIQVTAFDLNSIVNASSPYATQPYAQWQLPGSSQLGLTTANSLGSGLGCAYGRANGWMAYDPVASILYVAPYQSQYALGAQAIVYEWSVAPL